MIRTAVYALLSLALFGAFVYAYVASYDPTVAEQALQLEEEAARVEALAHSKDNENKKMRREIQALREDPRYLAIYARQHLNMVGPGEVVLHVVRPQTN